MFLGHCAVGFAAKRLDPRSSLGVLMGAALLPDLIWPVLLLAGWERVRIEPAGGAFTRLVFEHYPVSHSLAAVLGWALLLGGLYGARTRRAAGAAAAGLAVVSHWMLDALAHRPDLALYPGSSRFAGLGLWNWTAVAVSVELAIFAAGVWMYGRGTRGRDGVGVAGLWSFVAVLMALYAGSVAGPAPPSGGAIALAGLASMVFPLWAEWVDRHRRVAESGNSGG
jgi:membrane-bound metal-dependent hydrolase YbcI (DUF457 family)